MGVTDPQRCTSLPTFYKVFHFHLLMVYFSNLHHLLFIPRVMPWQHNCVVFVIVTIVVELSSNIVLLSEKVVLGYQPLGMF